MATIKEIAALAGVSRGTVDRVLNHRGSVNPETASKIEEIAKALDYRPNKAGITLAAQKKKLKLGVIIFSRENPFYIDVLNGIQEKSKELSGYGCSVLVKQISSSVEAQLAAIEELLSKGINGLALAPFNEEQIRSKINGLFEQGIPVVTLNTDIRNSKRLAYVGSHYFRSGETAAGLMHLMTGRPLTVGIVTGSPNILCHTERIEGFVSALKKHDPEAKIAGIVENHDDDIESYEQTMTLLKSHPDINALFFSAAGVYGGCRGVEALGLSGKLRILAFDKVPATRTLVEKGIIAATICQQPALQGSLPLEILFNYLTTGEKPKKDCHYVAVDIRIKENI